MQCNGRCSSGTVWDVSGPHREHTMYAQQEQNSTTSVLPFSPLVFKSKRRERKDDVQHIFPGSLSKNRLSTMFLCFSRHRTRTAADICRIPRAVRAHFLCRSLHSQLQMVWDGSCSHASSEKIALGIYRADMVSPKAIYFRGTDATVKELYYRMHCLCIDWRLLNIRHAWVGLLWSLSLRRNPRCTRIDFLLLKHKQKHRRLRGEFLCRARLSS